MDEHFNLAPRRRGDVISPPNTLKEKVGSGGLDESVLKKAQQVIDEADVDFKPLGEEYLIAIRIGMNLAKQENRTEEDEEVIETMLFPSMQMKANAGMFGFPLISRIASVLVQFLEVIKIPNNDALDIVEVFETSFKLILEEKVPKNDRKYANGLEEELRGACMRYFRKHAENIEQA